MPWKFEERTSGWGLAQIVRGGGPRGLGGYGHAAGREAGAGGAGGQRGRAPARGAGARGVPRAVWEHLVAVPVRPRTRRARLPLPPLAPSPSRLLPAAASPLISRPSPCEPRRPGSGGEGGLSAAGHRPLISISPASPTHAPDTPPPAPPLRLPLPFPATLLPFRNLFSVPARQLWSPR